jgi:hypothetical protein
MTQQLAVAAILQKTGCLMIDHCKVWLTAAASSSQPDTWSLPLLSYDTLLLENHGSQPNVQEP